jgi:hypothetical protein
MKTIIPNAMTAATWPCSILRVILIPFAFSSLAFAQRIQAVSPAPDGGYPGGNTAEGQSALLNLTTGTYNTAVGVFSLRSNIGGTFNTAIGAGTLLVNSADQNTATGAGALLSNTTATANTAYGAFALFSNTTGGTIGSINGLDIGPNVAVGSQALENNTLAGANTALGYQALHSFIAGPAGFEQAGWCTAIGFQALANATGTGVANSAFGYQALMNNTTGQNNTATSFYALHGNVTGDFNTADGWIALQHNTTGSYNTAVGVDALGDNIAGTNNIAVGYQAGQGLTTGSNNIYIGGAAGGGNEGQSNTITIGGTQTTTYIAGISDATLGVGSQVLVEGNGHLGVATSSRRFKENIQPMDKLSEALFLLNPVAFRYKKDIDPKGTRQLGLVAEEVEKVNPELVVHDKEGKPYTVRYEQVNAMLLNEFLKEHKKVRQLEAASAQQRNDFEATITELRKEIAGVAARSRDQDEKIQKLSAQVELNKTGSRTVANK